ncbi:DUF2079 domain-containing protein [Streptomyces sp. NPDC050856]|uniref:DUF2079 domain-containing protein n=1 Tax=Streptomyces sp. NPDC050856 TaxID=3154939 RepID=UPI0033E5BF4F
MLLPDRSDRRPVYPAITELPPPARDLSEPVAPGWRQAGQNAERTSFGRPEKASPVPALLLSLVCFLVAASVGFRQWQALELGGFDLGIFDQAMRGYADFSLPVSSVKNYHHEFPPGFSLLGDHFSPVLMLAAPVYWIWDDPRMLLLVQAGCFSLGVPLVRGIAARVLARSGAAHNERLINTFAFSYAVGWPLVTASRGDSMRWPSPFR